MKMVMKKVHLPAVILTAFLCFGFSQTGHNGADYDHSKNPYYSHTDSRVLNVDDKAWKQILPQGIYHLSREMGTERVYTGKYWDNYDRGTYYCAICGNPLFSSAAKYDSHTGRPSFTATLREQSLTVQKDEDGKDNEIVCSRCHSHMGYLLMDGPTATKRHYALNGDVLDFEPGRPGEVRAYTGAKDLADK